MSRWRERGALAACLAVVAAITLATGDREDAVPVSYADVAVGETGAATEFDVQVLDVQVTQQVQRDELGEPLVTDERYVVVDLTADARTGRVPFTGDVWLLTASGHRYGPRPEFSRSQPLAVEPGFSATGTFVFEVPADRLDGARLIVEPDTPLFLTHDVTVRVDLGLTGTTAPTGPVALSEPSIEVTP